MKQLIPVAFLLCISSVTSAYSGSPTDQVDAFFKDYSAGKTNNSIDNLYSNNPAMKQKIQALTVMKQQLASISSLYGRYLGNENISIEKISPSITRIVQVSKHNLLPVIWEFYFYKPNDTWIISQAMFVDQFQVVGLKK